jgi:uncharacterized protein involved in exopolysaccharide biosynthesis
MGTPTVEFWVEMLCRRWVMALQVGLVAFGIVALGSLAVPPTYHSAAKVLVQSNRAQLLVSPGLQEDSPSQPSAMANPVTEEDLNSETELLGSPYLIRQALTGAAAAPPPSGVAGEALELLQSIWSLPGAGYDALHNVPEPTSTDLWAAKIERHLSISVIKRSNVIEIDFSSHDPEWSRDFLDRLLRGYLELHARISHDPEAEKFFETQRVLLEMRLNRAQEKLRSAQMQTGITEVSAQEQALITQLYAAEADYHKTSAEFESVKERVANIQAQLARTPQRVAKESKVVQNLALQQLKPEVLQMEAERAELLSRYQPTSARITEIDAKLKAARKILDRENHLEVQETTTDVNPTWSALDADLANARSEVASVAATQATEARQVDALNLQLKNLAGDGMEIDRLQLAVDTDKQAFLAYVRKGEEARAGDALNRSRILNVTVVENPARPVQPDFPKIPLNLAVGLLLGIALGIGAAHWAETHDPRICSVAAIADLTGLPTVAVLDDRL